MSATFDPYHKWLGILPKDQPPHHYRLLGLEPFEDDLQVIEAAADRQLGFLRKFQSGEHAVDCQKLLNEVSRARLCLLKPVAKQAYDSALKEQLAGPVEAEIAFEPVLATSHAVLKSPGPGIVAWASAVVLLLLVVGGLAYMFSGSAKVDKPLQPAVADTNPEERPSEPEPDKAAKSPDSGTNPEVAQPEPKPDANGQVSILPLLKPVNIVAGSWSIKPDRLESLAHNLRAQVALPVSVPAEYTLHVEGTRLEHPNAPTNTCAIGLVCGNQQCIFGMDVDPRAGISGLEMVDGRIWKENSTTLPGFRTTVGKPFQLDAIVRKEGIEVRMDGRTIVDWRGSFDRLKRAPGQWDQSDPKQLFVGAESKYVFTKVTLGPPLPPRKLPGADLKSGESVELMKLVDLKRDVWNGDWLQEGLTMKSSAESGSARFAVPYQVPEEYELVADIQSDAPGRSFYIGLPIQSGHAGVGIGGRDGASNALLVDFAAWYREPHIAHQEQFLTTERHQVVATVRKNHLTVKVGERTVFDWKGDPRRFIAWPDWATPGNLVTIGTNGFSFRIHSLKLTRLAPSESFPKPSPPRNGDLLAIVDLDRDTTQGSWTKTAKGVEGSPHNSNGLRFPAQLPANYEFRLVAERKSNSESLLVKFPVAGHPVQVDLGFILRAARNEVLARRWFFGMMGVGV